VMDILKTENWNLGGEGSGHILCLDQTTTGDGLIAALNVLAEMLQTKKSLATLKLGMKKFTQTLINVKLPNKNLNDCMAHPTLQEAIRQKEEELSTAYQGGRVLLRASGTESLVRVMVEGESDHMLSLQQMAQELAEIVKRVSE
jgi:phosphoglucosamine mutase